MMDAHHPLGEGHKLYRSIVRGLRAGEEETPPHAVATATAVLAEAIQARAIAAYTQRHHRGAVARKRPAVPIWPSLRARDLTPPQPALGHAQRPNGGRRFLRRK